MNTATATARYLDSELGKGTHVYWISNTGLIDTSAKGIVREFEGDVIPVDPDGQTHDGLRWVDFGQDDVTLYSIDNLIHVSALDA